MLFVLASYSSTVKAADRLCVQVFLEVAGYQFLNNFS